MGGWSTSYRWNGVTRNNVEGLIDHHCRDVDRANDVEVRHSNSMINSAMTPLNETMVNDGAGQMVRCTDSEQWSVFMDKRLKELQNTRTLKDGTVVNVAHRKDANVVVDVVMQLDPEFTGKAEDMSAEERVEADRLMNVMVDQAIEHAGAENVIGYSKHWDETNPHVQMLYVPATDDGRLSMKQKLGGKGGQKSAQARYGQMHDDMRRSLQAAGYDATMQRVDAGRPHRRLKEFKEFKDREADVEYREDMMAHRSKRLDKDKVKLTAAKAEVEQEREYVRRERSEAKQQGYAEGYAQGAAEGRSEVAEQLSAVQQQQTALDALERSREEEWESELNRLRQFPPVMQAYYDRLPNEKQQAITDMVGRNVGKQAGRRPKSYSEARAEMDQRLAASGLDDQQVGEDTAEFGA